MPRLRNVGRKVRYAKAGAFNIAYQIVGDGPVDLVLSPGWATHLDLAWDIPPLARLLNDLASFSRLILFDKRGTGLSDRFSPDSLPTLEERMSDLRAVMDAAGAEHAALFGTLGGGAMSGLFAASFPERTRALILYGTFAKLEPTSGVLARLADSPEAALDRVEKEWGRASVGLDSWAPSALADELLADSYLRLLRSSMSPSSARGMMELGFQVDWTASLPAIRVPTLVLHRRGDLIVPFAHGRALADGIAGSSFVELPGIDHLMWVGDQDSIVNEVRTFIGGLAPARRLDRRLATILFTDIVGSTQTAVRLGDRAWRTLLHEHHRVVRSQIRASDGHEVETAGDGFLVTFDAPATGIRCARSIIEATSTLGLELRTGIHTGECEVSEDGIQGVAVHTAARVAALAAPHEILVSRTVRDLSSGAGIRFEDRGTHDLKGIPGRWELFSAEPGGHG
ncbi:MAG: hydrolase [Actinomycetia bacterium]|nr:hydrolase [Actinomycetes bacterium]